MDFGVKAVERVGGRTGGGEKGVVKCCADLAFDPCIGCGSILVLDIVRFNELKGSLVGVSLKKFVEYAREDRRGCRNGRKQGSA